jgi:D-alanyl-D-alanine endopeptidase (penicillin-binding protein 7)
MTPATLHLLTSIGWTLIHFVWQGALVGCATAVALAVLRHSRPEHRYMAACAGLLACVAWPAWDLYLRAFGAHPGSASERFAMGFQVEGAGFAAHGLLAYLQSNLVFLVACWAIICTALALRLSLGLIWIGRAVRQHRSDPHWQTRLDRLGAQFGLTRDVRLRIVDGLASPITAGWWQPVVLVPSSLLTGMAPDLLEALLAHELAHVKRFDYLVNLGQNLVETLLFYHPAVWWISSRIRAEREQIADDLAARQLGEPRRLALALSELDKLQFSTHHLAQAANGGDLMVRIKRLIRPDSQALNWKAAVPALGLAIGCMAAVAHASQPVAADTGGKSAAVVNFATCAKPHYPKEDLQANHEGTVTLSFLVGTQGQVKDAQIQKSSGYPAMDESARDAIAKCTFKPATSNGTPVETWAKIQYVWATK